MARIGYRAKSQVGKAIIGLLLVCAIALLASHTHPSLDPDADRPLAGPHHCVLCMVGQQPLVMTASATIPVVSESAAIPISTLEVQVAGSGLEEFSLYMRPPPSR